MSYSEVTSLSMLLVISIFFDTLRFPLLKKDRGSKFFGELSFVYFAFIIISMLVNASKDGHLSYPLYLDRFLWTLHFLSFPLLLGMWMHFNAINIITDAKLVTRLTWIHAIPLIVLIAMAVLDIPNQHFYPLTTGYEHLLPSLGTYYMIGLSAFYCLAMVLATASHYKDLQGSFLFISFLLPATFIIALASFWVTQSYSLFMVTNAFMMVLFYLIGQKDSIKVDSLTGLPTDALLQRKLLRIFRAKSTYTLILIDIENFRYFNSRYGRLLGDRMLVALAEYLTTLGSANEVFRLESDRFCLCVPGKGMTTSGSLVKRIGKRLEDAWELGDTSVYIQANLAVINVPQQVSSREEFKQATDQLFMEMKGERRRSVLVYTRQGSGVIQRRLNIITTLRHSVRNPEQVQVYYQPIYELSTGNLVAAEALMRIEDKELGLLQPSDFIALAEQTGLIVSLTQILLKKVCRMISRIPEKEEGSFEYISVNLSGADFGNKTIGKTLLSSIKGEDVDPKRIGFEITESVVLKSYEAVAEVMQDLSLYKITFALDDFGTGYSNVQALMQLPYQFVKFDRNVIHQSTANPKMLTLISEMLHKMDKKIIAEGVETEEELALIKKIGIERVQGFIFSKPLKAEEFLALMAGSQQTIQVSKG